LHASQLKIILTNPIRVIAYCFALNQPIGV
jgi:hypothetical protein